MSQMIATHNWMRPESIKRTIERMKQTGVDALEISGEPDQFNTKEVRALLKENGRTLLGLGHAHAGRAQPRFQEHGAAREDGRLHEACGDPREGTRWPDHHAGAGHGGQSGGRWHAGRRVEVARRGREGGLCARREGRHPHRHRTAEPLRDLPDQPRRSGAGAGRRGRPELRCVPRSVSHEHRGERHPRGLPQVQGSHLRRPHRRQQPLRARHGNSGLSGDRQDDQVDRATRAH